MQHSALPTARHTGTRLLALVLTFLNMALLSQAHAQTQAAPQPYYDVEVRWPEPQTRYFHIKLTVPTQSGNTTSLAVAAWRPGRYSLQNYAAGIGAFEAKDESGKPLRWRKRDKDTWVVDNPSGGKTVTVTYQYYAHTIHNGASYLTQGLAYFNPVNFLMYAPGQLDKPARLTLPDATQGWTVVTQLYPTDKPNVFTAPDYHELADAPTVAAISVRQFTFDVEGTKCVASFFGTGVTPTTPTDAAGKLYIDGVSKIVRAHKRMFGEIPTPRYDFMYLVGPYGTGATEHSRSAMFVYSTDILKDDRAIGNTFGTTSHEFFHLYNIKRIRPASMWPYDYSDESPTALLWLMEGVTDYYADVLLTRAGIVTPEGFFTEYSAELTGVENDPTAFTTSPELASTNTWLEESNFRDPNRVRTFFGAIYTLGKRAGWLLDVEIRTRTKGQKSLDDVMRYLYTEYWKKNKGLPDDAVVVAAEAVTGTKFGDWYAQYVQSPGPIDYNKVLNPAGLRVVLEPAQTNSNLTAIGIDRLQQTRDGISIAAVRPGSDASQAGIAPGMLLLTVDGTAPASLNPSLADNWKPGDKVTLRVREVLGNVEPREVVVTFSGKNVPTSARIERIPGADTKWIEANWLKAE